MNINKVIIILTIGFVSCGQNKTQNWKSLDFGSFKLTTPNTWKIVKFKGIDSYVGGLTNGKDTLFFDYGWYSPNVVDTDFKTHKLAVDTVNGLLADIVIPNEDGKGSIGMSISHFKDEQDKFFIGGTNISGTDTILQIFKSLKFPESDTTKNSTLTKNKFVSSSTDSGNWLFKNNCSHCHAKNEFIIGPPLKTIKTKRTFEWTYKFLTDRKSMHNDKEFLKLTKGQEYHCMEFQTLTKKELQLIIDFLN